MSNATTELKIYNKNLYKQEIQKVLVTALQIKVNI